MNGNHLLAAIVGIMLLLAIFSKRSLRPLSVILVGLVAVVLLVGVAWTVTHFAQERAVAEAKAYPALIEPLLEAYRQTHGSYPTSLDQLPTKPAIPRLLRRPYGYRSDGTSYSFSFLPPDLGFDTWDYLSTTKKWHTT